MRFAMFKGEKSIAELASRLFEIQGRGAQAASNQAAQALLKANPRLKDLSKVPAGSLIAVPDNAPPLASGEEVASPALLRSIAFQNVQAEFDTLQQRLSDLETSALAQLQSATARFQTAEMNTALKTLADAKVVFPVEAPSLSSIAKDTEDMVKNVQTAQDARKQVRAQLVADLALLAK